MDDTVSRDGYTDGKPTEEGYFFAVICEGWKIPFPRLVFVYAGALYTLDDHNDWELFTLKVIAYQKVLPYKGRLLVTSKGKNND